MKLLALAITGGALGSGLRYFVNREVTKALGGHFPWGIFLINVTGCFAMGLLAGAIASRGRDEPELRAFLGAGVLGGYTTFSAFSLDFAYLWQSGHVTSAAVYLLGSVGLAVVGVFAGLAIARVVFQ
jgi:fluoride exporter